MKNFLLIFILISNFVFGQTNCYLKLVDSYSLNNVQLDNSIKISNADFSLDTINDIVLIEKIRGNNLEILIDGYNLYTEKIKFKNYKNDTVVRQLVPNDSIISIRFKEMWDTNNVVTDTLFFNNLKELKIHIFSYLNYLTEISKYCDNGLCDYSNTYKYQLEFEVKNSVYVISKIEKQQPSVYKCDELEKYLNIFPNIFPKFLLKGKKEKISISFTMKL
ncbi:MAG: hypothetical protein VR77_03630 [Flavobacteriales bacterium BRH_c54]|nr:MAG: hypothetical protein VR77_03630 [Flavobacteriales bacterium BRH_c54]